MGDCAYFLIEIGVEPIKTLLVDIIENAATGALLLTGADPQTTS